jgi:nucleolar protein 53
VDTATLTDAWGKAKAPTQLPGGYGTETVNKPTVRTPKTLAKLRAARRTATASQIEADIPTTGVSYNPAAAAHAALISEAVEEELGRLATEARADDRAAVLGEVVAARRELDIVGEEAQGMVRGMRVSGHGEESEAEAESDADAEAFKPKQTKRKTQAQRNKALRARDAKEAAKLEAERRRLEKAVPGAKTLGKGIEARKRAEEEAKRLRKLAAEQRERVGFAGGEKIGRHRVGKKAVEVQLGEDLAESLRQIKVSTRSGTRETSAREPGGILHSCSRARRNPFTFCFSFVSCC